jgi:hypothetical protein
LRDRPCAGAAGGQPPTGRLPKPWPAANVRREIEAAARWRSPAFIGNANLIDETTAREIYEGYRFMRALAAESGLPLVCVTAAGELLPRLDLNPVCLPAAAHPPAAGDALGQGGATRAEKPAAGGPRRVANPSSQ